MSRGWTELALPVWDKEGYYDKVKAKCDMLAAEWSRIHDAAEKRNFQRLSEHDYGNYDMEPDEWEMMKEQEKLQDELEAVQMQLIEDKLGELGARMMRPYEHWNEEERYMQYMEVDRFA